MTRYTCFRARGDDEDPRTWEEIDVDAESAEEARRLAEAELARDYIPGGRVVRVVPRFGLYL